MRERYEQISPLEEAKSILHAYQQLADLRTMPVMKQFAILSGDVKTNLKRFLIDLQNLERAANKEETNAKNEIRKTAVPEGMDDIVKAAKTNLAALHEQLNEMEV